MTPKLTHPNQHDLCISETWLPSRVGATQKGVRERERARERERPTLRPKEADSLSLLLWAAGSEAKQRDKCVMADIIMKISTFT